MSANKKERRIINTAGKLNAGLKSGNGFIILDFYIHIMCFICVLLIGADIWGIDIGVNLRFDQLCLCIFVVLLIVRNSYLLTFDPWIIVFAGGALISTVLAVSIVRGVMFYCFILYNILFVFYAFKNYIKTYGLSTFIRIFRNTLYVQFVIMMFQVFLKVALNYELDFLPSYGEYKGIPRFSLWFYEPSYLTTYLSFWFALSLYMLLIANDKSYVKDIIMALCMFLFATSTTGFLAIILSCVVVYIMWLWNSVTLKKLIFPCIVLVGFIIFRFGFSSIYSVFFGRLFNQSLDSASGGRISAWAETWNVFVNNFLFGVGPGNYGLYLGVDAGVVPSNITLELLATLGIVPAVAFYCLTFSLCYRSFKAGKVLKCKEGKLIAACAVGLIIFTVILQANQGYLRLYHWMFFGILSGGLNRGYVRSEMIKFSHAALGLGSKCVNR